MAIANSLRAMHEQNKGAMTKTNLFMADLDLIEEEPGFNTREYDNERVETHIRNLADAYKEGQDIDPLRVKVVDGRIFVRDGHCRRRAAILARSEGAQITRLPVIEVRGDEIRQSLVIITSNDGLKLTPVERAAVYARLKGMGLTEAEIAAEVKRTKGHVQQYIALNDAPLRLKALINSGAVSWSLAMEKFNELGTAAIDVLERGVAAETATGEAAKPTRVTRKSLDQAAGQRSQISGKLAKRVSAHFGTLSEQLGSASQEGSELVIRLNEEQAKELRELCSALSVGSVGQDQPSKCPAVVAMAG